ncbi:MAG: hypothetical protein K0S08_2039 [Gammaproteobacteria bacterium]|jgi:hypothetical protein|nr:hypothetical protein [Gammaproteobacteria bacterium]
MSLLTKLRTIASFCVEKVRGTRNSAANIPLQQLQQPLLTVTDATPTSQLPIPVPTQTPSLSERFWNSSILDAMSKWTNPISSSLKKFFIVLNLSGALFVQFGARTTYDFIAPYLNVTLMGLATTLMLIKYALICHGRSIKYTDIPSEAGENLLNNFLLWDYLGANKIAIGWTGLPLIVATSFGEESNKNIHNHGLPFTQNVSQDKSNSKLHRYCNICLRIGQRILQMISVYLNAFVSLSRLISFLSETSPETEQPLLASFRWGVSASWAGLVLLTFFLLARAILNNPHGTRIQNSFLFKLSSALTFLNVFKNIFWTNFSAIGFFTTACADLARKAPFVVGVNPLTLVYSLISFTFGFFSAREAVQLHKQRHIDIQEITDENLLVQQRSEPSSCGTFAHSLAVTFTGERKRVTQHQDQDQDQESGHAMDRLEITPRV